MTSKHELEVILIGKVRQLLQRPELSPEPSLSLHRLPGWDSLRLMNLLMQLEKEWGVRFQATDVARLRSWGDLVAMVNKSKEHGSKNP